MRRGNHATDERARETRGCRRQGDLRLVGLCVAACLLVVSFGAGTVQPAAAQSDPSTGDLSLNSTQVRGPGPAAQMEVARHWIEKDRPNRALPFLQAIVRDRPAFVSSEHGSAAYWLGASYEAQGRSAKALTAWRDGVEAIRTGGRMESAGSGNREAEDGQTIPPRLADAYLGGLTPESLRGERLKAVRVYTDLLGSVGPASGDLLTLYRRHVAQLAPMMTDDELARVIREPRDASAETWTIRPDAGTFLQAWWRRLDPLPATTENERLEEHLARLTVAKSRYACSDQFRGLDDRGMAYLRFGAPNTARPIDFEGAEFFREVYRFGVAVSSADFPDNEFWLYTHIDRSGYYLFIREPGGCYTTGKPNDLLPRHLQHYRAADERGLNIAYSALMALRYVYRQLALLHPDFGLRYSEIADYAGWQETQAAIQRVENATGASIGGSSVQSVTVGAGVGQQRTVSRDPMFGIDAPNQFVPELVAQAQREDAAAARRRSAAMPRQHTNLLGRLESLPVAVRTVRRLQPDGRTTSRVYWGLRTGDLHPPDSEDASSAIVSVAATRYDTAYRVNRTVRSRHVVPASAVTADRLIAAPPLKIGASSDPVHFRLQFDQAEAARDGGRIMMGELVRRTTARSDSLMPLRAGGAVEMSDLHVLVPPSNKPAAEAFGADGVPYPFGTISTDMVILLAFDVYHLTFNARDRTKYQVSYVIEQRTRRGWTRFFRREETQRTATTSTYEGSSRRTEERIELDLADLDTDRPQDLRVTVRVTDAVSGESVDRSIDFVVK